MYVNTLDYVTFFHNIVHGFEYSEALNHSLKSDIPISGRQLLFFLPKKQPKKSSSKKGDCFAPFLSIF